MHNILGQLKRVSGALWAVLLLMLIFSLIKPAFMSYANIMNILRNASILLIVSIGMTIVILSGQINISVGGIVALCAVLTATYLHGIAEPNAAQIVVAFAIGGATGLLFGLSEGVLIGKYNYNYWLVTFAGMSVSFGLAKTISDGGIIAGFGRAFQWVSTGKIYGVSMSIIFSIIICFVMAQFINKSRFCMHVYAIGNSEKAAFNSGINVGKICLWIYAWCGLLSGIAAVFLVARTNSAGTAVGIGYEFNAIAAVVIGGTSLEGGKGGVLGTVFGTIFIAALKNGLQVVGLNVYWQQAYLGLIIAFIIIYDVTSARARATKNRRRIYHDR